MNLSKTSMWIEVQQNFTSNLFTFLFQWLTLASTDRAILLHTDARRIVFPSCSYSSLLSGVHVTMESLLDDKDLMKKIKDLVRGSGRCYPQKDLESGQANGVGSAKLQLGSELPPLAQTNIIPNREAVALV